MSSRFLQIHTLTSYPASLLNRDDVGFAKRIGFGNATRIRVSSQCLKRHWRRFEGEGSLESIDGVRMSVRSRRTFGLHIQKPLEESGVEAEVARVATAELMALVLGDSGKKPKKDEEAGPVESAQVTVLGPAELAYLLEDAKACAAELAGLDEKAKKKKGAYEKAAKAFYKDRFKGDRKKNLQTMVAGAGLDAALFGRMVTSDFLSHGDAALHVAHAFTVHAQMAESDYFSAVDDLLDEGETGSGHINSTELSSGLFYTYVVIDLPLLVSNLEGCARGDWKEADRTLAAEVVRRFVHLMATVSPGAKLGSTAPYAYAHAVMVEAGNTQPRTLANAFLKSVSPKPDLIENTYTQLAEHVAELDRMYGAGVDRALSAIGPSQLLSAFDAPMPLSKLADHAASLVRA